MVMPVSRIVISMLLPMPLIRVKTPDQAHAPLPCYLGNSLKTKHLFRDFSLVIMN